MTDPTLRPWVYLLLERLAHQGIDVVKIEEYIQELETQLEDLKSLDPHFEYYKTFPEEGKFFTFKGENGIFVRKGEEIFQRMSPLGGASVIKKAHPLIHCKCSLWKYLG